MPRSRTADRSWLFEIDPTSAAVVSLMDLLLVVGVDDICPMAAGDVAAVASARLGASETSDALIPVESVAKAFADGIENGLDAC